MRPESGTPPLLDEERAWRLLLRIVPGRQPDGQMIEVRLEEPGAALLRVEPTGAWTSDPAPTEGARRLLDLFLPVRVPAALVVGQLAQGLDGRIATESGHSHYVSGPEDLDRLHRLRALVDAVIVGAGTVALDDPRLTVRRTEGANPVRVVLDPDGRLDPASRIFSDGAAPTLVVQAEETAGDSGGGGPAVEYVHLPRDPDIGLDPGAVIGALGERGMKRILVEGGGITVSRFLEAGTLDRLHLTVAPLIIGSGRPGITLPPVASLDEALRPACRRFLLGPDVLFDLDLRRPAGAPTRREGS